MPRNMKFASVAAALILGLFVTSNLPSIKRFSLPWSGSPSSQLRDARYRLERLEDRMKLERDVAERAEANAQRARSRLNYIKKHRYPLAVMMEWDATVTAGQQAAMARQDVVRRSEAEHEDLMDEIRRLEDAVAEENKR
ncbi:hypothetical protein TA3x_001093 [Tundrisphaera sp. TA3]|uniref:hypothetical protein n=1 Tax=Tundrisphaera sp. TA3 TaxID=3435775 RepID=UPI003EBA685C